MLSFTAVVSGEQVARELADDPEEAALAVVEFAVRVDLTDLGDYLEDELNGRSPEDREALSQLASALLAALETTRRDT